MKRNLFGLFCLPMLLLSGCTEVDVKYPDPVPVPVSSGTVVVTPEPAMPAGTVYYFYDAQGNGLDVPNALSDGNFSGELPFGTYRLLAVKEVGGVEFREMGRFDTASAYLSVVSSAGSRTLVSQPAGEVLLLCVDRVVVEEGKTATYITAPAVPLTRSLTLNVDLSRVQGNITAFSGSLNGFYPGVILSSRLPITAPAPVTALSFPTGSSTRAALPGGNGVPLRSFGWLDPNPAVAGLPYVYRSELLLALTFSDRDPLVVTVDLTESLAGILSGGHIDVPIEEDAPVVPDPDPVPVNPGGGIDDWEDGGTVTPNQEGRS